MKKTILMIAAAVCLLAAAFLIWKHSFSQQHMLDGDGMERKDTGVEENECGKWLSDQTPQWSAVLEKYKLILYHYGSETASVRIRNYMKPDSSGEYRHIETDEGITFSWPYTAYETAEFRKIYLDTDRLQLTFRLDNSTDETFSFRKAGDGEKEETELMMLDEDALLTEVRFHQQGTYMSPYYILAKTDEGYEIISSYENIFAADTDGDQPADAETFAVSEEDVRMLGRQLLEYNVLAWDGFNESTANDPGMLDGDSGFTLKLQFSEGTAVSASGYNAQPANGNEILSLIVRFFMTASTTGESTD